MSFKCNGGEEDTAATPSHSYPRPSSTISRLQWRWGRMHLLPVLQILTLVALLFLGGGKFVNNQLHTMLAPPMSNASTSKSTALTLQQISAMGRLSTVYIEVPNCPAAGAGISAIGSGVIIDSGGYIVTNYHVVADGTEFHVALDDDTLGFYDDTIYHPLLSARLIGVDPPDDLAVLKITTPKRLLPIPLGNSSQTQVGDDAIVIGAPGELSQTVTFGHISALNRNFRNLIGSIQTDASINPGSSGGALINAQGQLIGIATEGKALNNQEAPGLHFAIPSNRVRFIVPQLIQYGRVIHNGHATIGAAFVSVDQWLAEQDSLAVNAGALITNVLTLRAEDAGLRRGDVIVQMNATPINTASDLTDALMTEDRGSKVTLDVMRGSQLLHLPITLGEIVFKDYPTSQCVPTHPKHPTGVPGRG